MERSNVPSSGTADGQIVNLRRYEKPLEETFRGHSLGTPRVLGKNDIGPQPSQSEP